MNIRRDPVIALAGLFATIVAASLATAWVSVGDAEAPALILAVVAGIGLVRSHARWSWTRSSPTPINLALTFVVAFAVVATRATLNAGDPPGGLHAVAEAFLLVLTVRSFAMTDCSRVRSALIMSMAAVLAAVANVDPTTAIVWVVVWLVAAVVTLLAAVDLEADRVPRLRGSTARKSSAIGRRGAAAAILIAVVLVAALAVVIADPDPGTAAPRAGDAPGRELVAPYAGYTDHLDTSLRGDPGNEVIMTVQASAPDFWRGQTFDHWDGREWRASDLVRSSFPTAGSGSVIAGIGDVEGGGETFVQHVRIAAPEVQLLFGANRIDQVDTAVRGMVVHGDGSIELRTPMGKGAEYTVISLRQPVTAALLRAHDPTPEAIPQFISGLYLQLPDVPARVTALAHQITDGLPTAYDKEKAIERWLRANTEYTRDIPALPAGADAVDQHLFVDRRGFCEQIATSTAVLLRSVGVPARVAAGFVPGDESLLGGEFTVHAGDGHAWVEVWFPGVGWQGFDPTASVPLAGESSTGPVERIGDLLRALAPFFLAALVAALVAAIAWFIVGTRRRRRAASLATWAHRLEARLEQAGTARGRPRAAAETPVEYASALADGPLADPRLVGVGATVSRAAYGSERAAPDVDERAWAEGVLDEAERRAPVRRRRWGRRALRGS